MMGNAYIDDGQHIIINTYMMGRYTVVVSVVLCVTDLAPCRNDDKRDPDIRLPEPSAFCGVAPADAAGGVPEPSTCAAAGVVAVGVAAWSQLTTRMLLPAVITSTASWMCELCA